MCHGIWRNQLEQTPLAKPRSCLLASWLRKNIFEAIRCTFEVACSTCANPHPLRSASRSVLTAPSPPTWKLASLRAAVCRPRSVIRFYSICRATLCFSAVGERGLVGPRSIACDCSQGHRVIWPSSEKTLEPHQKLPSFTFRGPSVRLFIYCVSN